MKTTLLLMLFASGGLLSAGTTRDDANRRRHERENRLAAEEIQIQADNARTDARKTAAADRARQATAAAMATIEVAPLPRTSGSSSIKEINAHFDAMERKVRHDHQKQIHAAKNEINALEDQIKEINQQVQSLQAQARKIEQVAARMAVIETRIRTDTAKDTAARFRTQTEARARIAAILEEIEQLEVRERAIRQQIADRERQIAVLQESLRKAIAALHTMRAKALASI